MEEVKEEGLTTEESLLDSPEQELVPPSTKDSLLLRCKEVIQ